jgi:hypothetical protein
MTEDKTMKKAIFLTAAALLFAAALTSCGKGGDDVKLLEGGEFLSNAKYEYEYDGDGFPVKETMEGINEEGGDYITTTSFTYIDRMKN